MYSEGMRSEQGSGVETASMLGMAAPSRDREKVHTWMLCQISRHHPFALLHRHTVQAQKHLQARE